MKKWRLILALLMSLAVIPLASARPAMGDPTYVCFPTCSEVDARFLTLEGTGLQTLAGDSIGLEFMAGHDATAFEIGIFDGDSGGRWDLGLIPARYTLYADPAADGSGTQVVAEWLGNAMQDNAWSTYQIPTDERAKAPSGNYYYHMRVTNTNPTAAKTASNFKVRTSGMATLKAPLAFSFIAALYNIGDVPVIYPSWSVDNKQLEPTTYDGTWNIYLDIPASTPFLAIWDGDFDHGPYNCSDNDTDDADTPNDVIPAWALGTTADEEGVATSPYTCSGQSGQYTTGAPNDDNQYAMYLRPPSVIYEVIGPSGTAYTNTNPSGNSEWEQFRIETDPGLPADYHITQTLQAGLYQVHVTGMDLTNLNAWRFNYDVLGLCADGTACKPILRPYRVGDTVWYDTNANGVQDPGEPGIDGVILHLLDSNGAVLATTTTADGGKYSFEVEGHRTALDADGGTVNIIDGTYTVQAAAKNMAENGVLAGLYNTAGGTGLTNQVTDGNVDTYNFGYVQPSAAIGNQVWRDSNGNGVYEPELGELPIANVTVQLYNAAGSLVGSSTTGVDGLYLFQNLAPGSYKVEIAGSSLTTVLNGYMQTYDYDGTLDNQTSHALTVQSFEDADFGYRPATSPGTGTPGYWKTHAEAWPTQLIALGGEGYSPDQAITIMGSKKSGDKTYDLFRALVSAKLNVGIGNDSTCISGAIATADAWLVAHPLGSEVGGSSAAWQEISAVYLALDGYNNGLMCAPPRN